MGITSCLCLVMMHIGIVSIGKLPNHLPVVQTEKTIKKMRAKIFLGETIPAPTIPLDWQDQNKATYAHRAALRGHLEV